MDHLFSVVRQSKISEDIAAQIKTLISEGALKPGEKLPSERELARMMGVGRSSLREAVNSLRMMGLVDVHRRKGIYVSSVSHTLITDPLRELMAAGPKIFSHLYDIRIDIEVAAARVAAENRADEHLDAIAKHLEALKNRKGEKNYDTGSDLQFHLAVAEATGNFLRVHIVKEIFDLADNHIHSALNRLASQQDNFNIIYTQHAAIYEAIAQKAPSRAAAAMQTHLQWVKSQLHN